MRPVFHDPVRNHDFIHQGYSHVPLLSEAETTYLRNELRRACPDALFAPQGDQPAHRYIYSSYMQNELHLRQVGDRLVREVLTSHVEALLDRYRILSCGFFIKAPRGGELDLHAHWLVTESLQDTVVNIWCPLQETTVANGTFHAVPGSHKIFPEIITFGYKPFYHEYAALIREQYSLPLPSQPGQAVIFDDTMFHWSPDNLTDQPRYALHCTCIPREATATYIYFDKAAPQQFEVYEADDAFFVQNGLTQERSRPTDLKRIGTLPNTNQPYTRTEFETRMRDGDTLRSQLCTEMQPLSG